MSLLLAVQGD